ncbi:MAG: peptidoglycan DD-metalloendopeptidase family protein [Geobacteraceae bacterium]|nr:peptidoglycan DD-metalloendopeptidase family protein [Geobacteraceae bacterium]
MPIKLFIILILVCFFAASAFSADVKKQLQGIKTEISQKKVLIKKTSQVENRVTSELTRINTSLREKEASLSVLNRDLRSVEGSIGKTQQAIEAAQKEANSRKAMIQKRLVAAYKAGDTGTVRFLFSSQSIPQMQENLRYMKAVVDNDRKLVAAYNEQVEVLRRLKRSMEGDARRKAGLKGSIEQTKRQIEQEKVNKTNYLTKVREEKKAYQSSLAELEANSRRLHAIVQRLEAESRKRYTARKRKQIDAVKKAQAKTRKKSRIKAGKQTPDTSVDTAEIQPMNSSIGFASQKGRLSMPARGRIIGTYGRHKHPEFNSFTFSNGISISAPSGTDVRTIYDGTVVFADYFKGYGNMVIVDHGGGFLSVYAHNSRVVKRAGASVSRNEVVASVGDVDSTRGPMLYFEIRYQGKAIDPSSWVR